MSRKPYPRWGVDVVEQMIHIGRAPTDRTFPQVVVPAKDGAQAMTKGLAKVSEEYDRPLWILRVRNIENLTEKADREMKAAIAAASQAVQTQPSPPTVKDGSQSQTVSPPSESATPPAQ